MTSRPILKWPKIYFYGDSLTQFAFSKDGCWAAVLANEFQRKADIIARGFCGYNTRQCKVLLPYLEHDLKDVTVAGIFLGANDASDPETNQQQAVPLEEYKCNLKDIVNHIKKKNDTVKPFLVTPPALDEEKWRINCESEGKICGKSSSLTTLYAIACQETAKQLEIPCVDIHGAMMKQNDWKEYLVDGLHFSSKGSTFLASQISPLLQALMESQHSYTDLMPIWSDLDNNDLNGCFNQWMKKNGF